jgi:hypothetical protein
MNFFRRFFNSWPIAVAAVIALLIYLDLPKFVRMYDATTGVYDGGYLLWFGLGIALAFAVGAAGWVLWQLLFASLDKLSSNAKDEWGNLKTWFCQLPDTHKYWAVQGTFVFTLLYVLLCLWLVSDR